MLAKNAAPKSSSANRASSSPPDVATVARVDADDVAAFDEERNGDGRAGLELGRLRRVRRGVAFEAGIGFDDLQLDVSRKVDADRRAIVELHVDDHAVLQEIRGIADEVALKRDVFEASPGP